MTDMLHRPDRPPLATRTTAGRGPAILFLPGYMSDMSGSKATMLFDWAAARGQAAVLFDYAGCGASGGRFADQTLADWRDDALAVTDALVPGPVVLVGSSMGGWLMLLVAEALAERRGADAVAGLVGIAAAPDFTEWGFDAAQRAVLMTDGVLREASDYGPDDYVTTRAFWESGQALRCLNRTIAIDAPVRLLHGQADVDVPWELSLQTATALRSAEVQVTLVKDGDHRLSRDGDLALLRAAVASLLPESA